MKFIEFIKSKKARPKIIGVGVALSVVALAFSLFSLFVRAPSIPGNTAAPHPDSTPAVSEKQEPKHLLNNKEPESEEPKEVGEQPTLQSGDRRDGVYTILLVGTSDGYMTDTIMVISMDTKNGETNLVGIPSDTQVDARRALKKINGAYGVGGIDQVKKEVAGIIGFSTDFYVKMELEGLIALVDSIDGIDFDVPQRMKYDDPTQNLHIDFQPGLQHLDGQAAMEMIRFRGYAAADLRRMEVQQEFLMAVANKLMTASNILKINEFAEIYKENVETDLTVGNLVWLGMRGYEIGTDNIFTHTLPTYSMDVSVNPSYYQFISSKEALDLINSTINPYREDISKSNVSHPQFKNPNA